jgi:adenine-specific DNA methylase
MVKKAVEPIDIEELGEGFKKLEYEVSEEIKKHYRTICPRCLKKYARSSNKNPEEVIKEVVEKLKNTTDPREVYQAYSFKDNDGFFDKERNIFADAMYYFWIKEIPCLNCSEIVPLFKSYMLAHKKKGKKTIGYYLICPKCGYIFEGEDYKKDVVCPKCEIKFNPKNDGRVTKNGDSYICPSPNCGQKSAIVETIQRTGKPKERMYAVEYYCPYCGAKDYKQIDEFDFALFEKAKEEYDKAEQDWLGRYIPKTKIQAEKNPNQRTLRNHGYNQWKDLFNERQLLSAAKLFCTLTTIELEEKIKDFFLLSFSQALEYNNMLCDYHPERQYIGHLFRVHAFPVTTRPVENNFWGGSRGMGTFRNFAKRMISAKKYNEKPFEKFVNSSGKNEKKVMKIKVLGKIGDVFNDNNSNAMLFAGDSSYLPIKDNSVDAVITDPPYFGNVMYSESADFFYVWLRLALKDKYEYFQSELSPKETEIVVKKVEREWIKSEEDFIEGLTAVFKESGRKLKEDGLMVFTFHHQEEKA